MTIKYAKKIITEVADKTPRDKIGILASAIQVAEESFSDDKVLASLWDAYREAQDEYLDKDKKKRLRREIKELEKILAEKKAKLAAM